MIYAARLHWPYKIGSIQHESLGRIDRGRTLSAKTPELILDQWPCLWSLHCVSAATRQQTPVCGTHRRGCSRAGSSQGAHREVVRCARKSCSEQSCALATSASVQAAGLRVPSCSTGSGDFRDCAAILLGCHAACIPECNPDLNTSSGIDSGSLSLPNASPTTVLLQAPEIKGEVQPEGTWKSRMRYAKLGAATVGGGALLAVTGRSLRPQITGQPALR
jgi:hypothetical protein